MQRRHTLVTSITASEEFFHSQSPSFCLSASLPLLFFLSCLPFSYMGFQIKIIALGTNREERRRGRWCWWQCLLSAPQPSSKTIRGSLTCCGLWEYKPSYCHKQQFSLGKGKTEATILLCHCDYSHHGAVVKWLMAATFWDLFKLYVKLMAALMILAFKA